MKNIKVKIKESEVPDSEILKRKNFNSTYKQFEHIKNSYAKISGFWGATIGVIVFIGLGSMELLQESEDVNSIKYVDSSSNENFNDQENISIYTADEEMDLKKENRESSSASVAITQTENTNKKSLDEPTLQSERKKGASIETKENTSKEVTEPKPKKSNFNAIDMDYIPNEQP